MFDMSSIIIDKSHETAVEFVHLTTLETESESNELRTTTLEKSKRLEESMVYQTY